MISLENHRPSLSSEKRRASRAWLHINPWGRMRHLGLIVGAIAVLISFLIAVPSASAQRIKWFVNVQEDGISKKPILYARVITADGFQFLLYKRKDNAIWGEFTLQRGSGEVM